MKSLSDQSKIYEEIIIPVLGNVANVYQALSVFDAVSLKASEINKTNFKNFFHYTQKVSLEYAVLCLCKLYDKRNKRYPKHTIYSLCNKIENDILECPFPMLDIGLLENLEFSNGVIRILSSPSSTTDVRKRKFFSALRHSDWISSDKNQTLKVCFRFRDKKIAHLEDVHLSSTELPDYYPSTEHIKWMADRAYDVCCLAMDIYGVDRLYMPTWAKGIRGNALGVIRKVLGVEIKNHEEMMSFYQTNNIQ